MQGKSAKRPANVGAPNQGGKMYICLPSRLLTNVSSLLPLLQASSTIYINGIVAVHPARLIVWLLLPSLPIAINNGIATIKLAEVLLLQTSPEGRGANQTPHHDTTIK